METIDQQFQRCEKLTNEALTEELSMLAAEERANSVALVIRLAEFRRRRLSSIKGYSSLFAYCTEFLRFSESVAVRYIAVAKVAKDFPSILTLLHRGRLHLVGAAMLAPYLDSKNYRKLLWRARGKSQQEIARMIAQIAPEKPKRDSIRILSAHPEDPMPTPEPPPLNAAVAPQDEPPLKLEPDSSLPSANKPAVPADQYRISFTASEQTVHLLRRAQEILRHRFPKGELDPIVALAMTQLLESEDRDLRRQRRQTHDRQESVRSLNGPRTRRIPESVKQAVWRRDGGRCAYIGTDGARCGARAWLEFDHVHPWAAGGSSSEPENIRLLCREHNRLAAQLFFGERLLF